MTLQHIVLFSFPEELSEPDAADMRGQVAAWPDAIGGMTRLRFGSDLTGARTNGYSRLLYMGFAAVRTNSRRTSSTPCIGVPCLADGAALRPPCIRLRPGHRHGSDP